MIPEGVQSSRPDSARLGPSQLKALVREFGLPPELVERAYAQEIERLAVGARIGSFLTVLAANSVRTQLRRITTLG